MSVDTSQRIARLSPEKRALLAQRLRERAGQRSPAATIGPRPDRTAYPLSFAQQRLWFLSQLEPDSPLYNVPAAVHMEGPLHVGALSQSMADVLQRHEVLRSSIQSAGGQPVQTIHSLEGWSLPVADLTVLPEPERRDRVTELATEEAQRPFDLAKGPLVRARLLRLGDEEHVLLLTMHHIVTDGWSIGVLLRELGALYAQHAAGVPSSLPSLPIQYADYAAWQREWLRGERLERLLRYWRERLAGDLPTVEMPTDRPRPATRDDRGATETLFLGSDVVQPLRALAEAERASLFMALLAGLNVLLYRYTGQTDLCVGSTIANRNRAETEGLIGFLVNTLVLRTDLPPRATRRCPSARSCGAHATLRWAPTRTRTCPSRSSSRTSGPSARRTRRRSSRWPWTCRTRCPWRGRWRASG